MQSELVGLLMMLSIGGVQAAPPAPPEPPRQGPTLQAAAEPVRSAQPRPSSVRKAEVARRMFWLAMSLRNGG